MSNQYRATTKAAAGMFGDEVFDADYTPTEEADWLARGLLELVPRPYRVLSNNYTVGGQPVDQESVVELALPVEQEAALIAGGHLERVRRDAHPTVEVAAEVDPEPDPPTRRRRTSTPVKE